jgi:hypothetical protein
MCATPTCRYRNGLAAAAWIGLLSMSGCGTASEPPPIDLLAALPAAERRAGSDVRTAIRDEWITLGSDRRRALVMQAPARVTWELRLPAKGRLRSALALMPDDQTDRGVTARVGMAGGRAYEDLWRQAIAPGEEAWIPIDVDLSGYGGWQWSVFYRPSHQVWSLVFAADAMPAGRIAWAEPRIEFRVSR